MWLIAASNRSKVDPQGGADRYAAMVRVLILIAASSVLLSGCLATSVVGGTVKATGAVVKGTYKVGKAVIP